MEKKLQTFNSFIKLITLILLITSLIKPIYSKPTTCNQTSQNNSGDKKQALHYKIAAIISILTSSAAGICIPLASKNSNALHPDSGIHFLAKSFAAGVILATGFIHILPDAFESLTSPCLAGEDGRAWADGFPVAGLVGMIAAIGTFLIEGFAAGHHKRMELRKAQPVIGDEEVEMNSGSNDVVGPVGAILMIQRSEESHLIRSRVISQILEVGIVIHSIIIGISLGATQRPSTIKPLIAALSFHQFFEGIGLGGCISQARFTFRGIVIMVLFFALTAPTGIVVGIGISSVYDENSHTSLIVEGILNSASAGILIYMALVDLMAPDIMNSKLQTNAKLQVSSFSMLVMGAFCMAFLAKLEIMN
ncbi:zinc transporter 3-like [Impatiens glandulifera]|uniref:zinc transporter 3-like n=1 Tax=Impatiens glandulifera TaxID=253017 RepID=UPI001FB08D08|nr:zinc transporter 3-like [Impatiens glandulifera]